MEAMAAATTPYRDSTDVMYAFGTGMILGGPMGLLSTRGNKRLRALSEAAIREDMAYEAAKSVARAADNNGDGGAAKSALDAAQRDNPAAVNEDFDVAPTARARADEIEDAAGEQDLSKWNWANRLQANYIGKLFGSTNETIRNVSARILEGGLLVDKGETRAFTAEGRMNNLHQTATTRFFTETNEDFKAWADKNGYNAVTREVGIDANEKFFT